MQHPQPVDDGHHARHDTLLIAAHAADDLAAADRSRAEAQLLDCHDCRALRDDLLAIMAATRTPATVRAPRDFRLTEAQARELRGTWRAALLAPFRPGRVATRRLATAFTTLGLVGVFVAGALPSMLGGGATAVRLEGGSGSGVPAAATTAPEAQFGPDSPTAQGGESGPKDAVAASAEPDYAINGEDSTTGGEADGPARQVAPSPLNLLLIGSLVLAGAGITLFGLRYAGRRLG
jgi:hypothetical protein